LKKNEGCLLPKAKKTSGKAQEGAKWRIGKGKNSGRDRLPVFIERYSNRGAGEGEVDLSPGGRRGSKSSRRKKRPNGQRRQVCAGGP